MEGSDALGSNHGFLKQVAMPHARPPHARGVVAAVGPGHGPAATLVLPWLLVQWHVKWEHVLKIHDS